MLRRLALLIVSEHIHLPFSNAKNLPAFDRKCDRDDGWKVYRLESIHSVVNATRIFERYTRSGSSFNNRFYMSLYIMLFNTKFVGLVVTSPNPKPNARLYRSLFKFWETSSLNQSQNGSILILFCAHSNEEKYRTALLLQHAATI